MLIKPSMCSKTWKMPTFPLSSSLCVFIFKLLDLPYQCTSKMKLLLLLSLVLALAYALPAPLMKPRAGSPIPGRYVMLKKDAIYVYDFGKFGGFTADMTDDILNRIRHLPGVEYVEQDAVVTASLGEVDRLDKKAYVTQSSSTWGLARISHKARGSVSYTYDSTAGANTCVYVIDTGIATIHPKFEGRATFVAKFAGGGSNTDDNGHGTHCAETIGSKTYGVAKKSKLFAVKVLDASGVGTNSAGCSNGVVGSMSLGGARSTAVNSATANAVAAGVFMAVAAGNEAQDASNSSPVSKATAYTVGTTDSSDGFASFSNFGSSIDILAPGVSIVTTWLNNGTNTISGTSMATPHVAGLAAYILGLEGKRTPTKLAARLTALSTKNVITGLSSDIKNCVAFNGCPNS
ncbi:oryzin precursor [Macroventuria anomochaeta]|uniref:Oryzin n=1 Tax=Macroventuria anomochaeta TaxID=301207 RepID=A0ACB6RUV2_9PLEO|nr:oryzin precursor [Macroventuria anomochaeta]KAF2624878.1 oryzin precursor [Macroventuria anomochaeta]